MASEIILFGSRLSPFVEKVARALMLKKVRFELAEPKSPLDFQRWNKQTRKIPVLRMDGQDLYDSTFICRRLDEVYREPPLLSADSVTAATQRTLEDWSDESLYWYGMALRWTAQNGPATAAQIFGKLPAPLRLIANFVGPRQIRAMTIGQGMGRLPAEVLMRELAGRLDDLVTLLGARPFFYADRVSIADLAIYGQFHMLRSGPTPEAAALIDERRSLMEHSGRVETATAE